MEEKFLHAEEPGAEKSSAFLASHDSSKASSPFDLSRLKGKNTFGSEERLRSKKVLEQLFKEGKSVSTNGFTLVYFVTSLSTNFPAQAAFSVPKRYFKKAVDRNRVK